MAMRLLFTAAAGLLFGIGLAISGMVNPMKIMGFLDIAGSWDPTLILVMAGGLIVTAIGYRFIFARGKPLFADRFYLPTVTSIDRRLVIGSALFGLGWGLSGFCPGPGVASLVLGHAESAVFVIAMALGALAARLLPE